MEIRYMRYFIAVAEEHSFSKAAERLHISQPPLSQQIQRMEAEIGTRLLDRTNRSVKMTHAGQAFLAKAYQTVRLVDEAVEDARNAEHGFIGSLRIGFVPSASLGFLPETIRSFQEKFPKIKITLLDLMTGEQVLAFVEDRIDIGFIRPPIGSENLNQMPVVRESFIAILQENHRLASGEYVDIRELRFEPFILVPHGLAPGLFIETLNVCASAGFYPSIYQEVGQMDIILNFVAEGLGVAILPESIRQLRQTGLAYRPLRPAPPIRAQIDAVWKIGKISPILGNFLESVHETTRRYLRYPA